MQVSDVAGRTFGRLRVLNTLRGGQGKSARVLCKCVCGNEKEIDKYKVTSGKTQSCGCLSREVAQLTVRKMVKDPEVIDKHKESQRRKAKRRSIDRNGLKIRVRKSHFRMNVRMAEKKFGPTISRSIIRKCYSAAEAHAAWWAFNIPTFSLQELCGI